MLRSASMWLGLGVLLSLLFPLSAVLKATGGDPLVLRLRGIDLAAFGALLGIIPALVLCRLGRIELRIPRWNWWIALLAVFSVLFLLLHVSWTLDLATRYVRDAIGPGGSLPLPISHLLLIDGAELASRLGVLVCVVGALVHLQHPATDPPPEEAAPRRRRRRRKEEEE
jgi:hypothetical protein